MLCQPAALIPIDAQQTGMMRAGKYLSLHLNWLVLASANPKPDEKRFDNIPVHFQHPACAEVLNHQLSLTSNG
jgi:hypothetical protein